MTTLQLFDFFYFEHHQPVVQEDLIAGVHLLADAFIGDGDARLVAFHVFCGEGEGVALLQKDLAVLERFNAEFGSLGIQHDGKGNVLLIAHLFDRCDLFCVVFISPVRKVDAGNVHAGVRHCGDGLFRFRCRTERTDDLCFFHINSSGKIFL